MSTFDPNEYNQSLITSMSKRGRRPTAVMIQVSARCNLKCKMCGNVGLAENKSLMDMDLFLKVLDDCRASGIDSIFLVTAWGEPLLHPRIFEMIDTAAEFKITISTNGTPLTDERIDRLAQSKLRVLQISFAGYDKQTYESVYVGGKFERVSENLRKLKAAVVRHRNPAQLIVNGVALKDDPDFVRRTTTFLMGLGFDEQEINIVLPNNFGGLYDPTGDVGSDLRSLKQTDRGRPVICSILADNPGVLVDGRVTACGCLDNTGALEIGKIGEQGLVEMRFGQRFQNLLEKFACGDIFDLPLCSKCDVPYGPTRLLKPSSQ